MIPLVLQYTEDPKLIVHKLDSDDKIQEYLEMVLSMGETEQLNILYKTLEGFQSVGAYHHAEYTRNYIENLNLNYLMN